MGFFVCDDRMELGSSRSKFHLMRNFMLVYIVMVDRKLYRNFLKGIFRILIFILQIKDGLF